MFSRNPAAKWQTTAYPCAGPKLRFPQGTGRGIVAAWAAGPEPGPAPDCQDRYPSPILRPGPLRVRPFFGRANARAFAGLARKSENPFDPRALRGDMVLTTTNPERGSFTCTNPCSLWQLLACWPDAMARSIPTARGSVPLQVPRLVRLPITTLRKAPLLAVLAARLPPIRACAADRLTRKVLPHQTATGATAPVAVCVSAIAVAIAIRGTECSRKS